MSLQHPKKLKLPTPKEIQRHIHRIYIDYAWGFAGRSQPFTELYIVYGRFPFGYSDYQEEAKLRAEDKLTFIINLSNSKKRKFLRKYKVLTIDWLLHSITLQDPVQYFDINLFEKYFKKDTQEEDWRLISIGKRNKKKPLTDIKNDILAVKNKNYHVSSKGSCKANPNHICFDYHFSLIPKIKWKRLRDLYKKQRHTCLTVDISTPELRRDSHQNAKQYIQERFIPELKVNYPRYRLNTPPLTIKKNYTSNCDE